MICISKSIIELKSVKLQAIAIMKGSNLRRDQVRAVYHGKMLISYSIMKRKVVVFIIRKWLLQISKCSWGMREKKQFQKWFQIVILLVAKLNVTKILIVQHLKLNLSASYSQRKLMILINGKELISHSAMAVLLKS